MTQVCAGDCKGFDEGQIGTIKTIVNRRTSTGIEHMIEWYCPEHAKRKENDLSIDDLIEHGDGLIMVSDNFDSLGKEYAPK